MKYKPRFDVITNEENSLIEHQSDISIAIIGDSNIANFKTSQKEYLKYVRNEKYPNAT